MFTRVSWRDQSLVSLTHASVRGSLPDAEVPEVVDVLVPGVVLPPNVLDHGVVRADHVVERLRERFFFER